MVPDLPHPHYLLPYRKALAEHGPSFEATLWRSREAQRLRFDVLIDLIGEEGLRHGTLLDAGCGHGDLAARLVERGIAFERCVGVDGLDELIQAANARHLPHSVFFTGDFVTDPTVFSSHHPDYVLFCGSLNTIPDETARDVVRRAFESANHGVALNFLGDRHHRRWAGEDLSPARRFDTVAWVDFALSLSSRVVFDQEYLDGHDVSLLVRHD